MAERKTTSGRSGALTEKATGGRASKHAAGSALTQAPNHRANGSGRGARAQPSADELGRRAWEATYKNRRKS